jgi:hypothetical protein
MTDAELWGLIVEYNNTVLSTFALFLTLVSGFLVVAYLVGNKLTQWQAAIVTSGFVLSTLLFAGATYGYGSRAIYLMGETSEQYRSDIMFSWSTLWLYIFLFILGILACLKFMWDVRHPKTD